MQLPGHLHVDLLRAHIGEVPGNTDARGRNVETHKREVDRQRQSFRRSDVGVSGVA